MSHPIFITTKFNPAEKRWDVVLMIGDYQNKEAADKEAQELMEMLRERGGGKR